MPPQGPDYPRDADAQLLVGVIFAESASKHSGGGENSDEKVAIGATFVSAAHYAATKVAGKTCYNQSLGTGTILSAVRRMAVAYNGPAWRKVMNGNTLRPAAELAKLNRDDAEHLKLSVEAVAALGALHGPKSVAALADRVPVGFNQAGNSPPSPRMERIGKLGPHTFYGFKAGREGE